MGNGNFGTVYVATYKSTQCAAKVLKYPSAAEENFEKQFDFLHSLDHENIVKHIITIAEPQSHYPIIVMELMDNNLKEYLLDNYGKRFPLLQQSSLCLDISNGLAYLHSNKIVHRNLCDDNILLNMSQQIPTAKISDFGISTILPAHDMSMVLTGLRNRRVYFSPEVRDDIHHSHSSVDIYSFGVLATQVVQVKAYLKGTPELHSLYREIPETHLMKATIKSCIFYNNNRRPKATDIAEKLSSDYLKSVLLTKSLLRVARHAPSSDQ